VRGGKGLGGIPGATDSYHQNAPAATTDPAGAAGRAGGARGGGRGGGQAAGLVAQFFAQGDKNNDQRLSKDEFGALSDAWYGKLDTANAGRVSQAEFTQRFAGGVLPDAPPGVPGGPPCRRRRRPRPHRLRLRQRARAAPGTRTRRPQRRSVPTTRPDRG